MKIFTKCVLILAMFLSFINVAAAQDDPRPKRVVSKQYIENAIENYTSKIASKPTDEDGYINRAYLNYLIGNFELAIKDYDTLISQQQEQTVLSDADLLTMMPVIAEDLSAGLQNEKTLTPEILESLDGKDLSAVQQKIVQRVRENADAVSQLENEQLAEQMEYTISGRVGKFLAPLFKPIGFDWQLTTASIGALAAKEVFVAQLGILYAEGEADEESASLRSRLRKVYSPLQAFCIMLFCLLSVPCFATLAIMKRELNSWKMMFATA